MLLKKNFLLDSRIVILSSLCGLLFFGLTAFILFKNIAHVPVRSVEVFSLPNDNGETTRFEVKYVDKFSEKLGPDVLTSGTTVRAEKIDTIFHLHPKLMFWAFFILLMITVVAGAVPPAIGAFRFIQTEFGLSVRPVVGTGILSVVLGMSIPIIMHFVADSYYAMEIVRDFGVLFKSPFPLKFVIMVPLLLTVPTVAVALLVGPAIDTILPERSDAKKRVDTLITVFRACLSLVTFMLVMSVVTTMLLERSVNDMVQVVGFPIFPPESAMAYGLLFTLIT